MFFFKRKKIILEAYGQAKELIDLFPPVKTQTIRPEWYKGLDKEKPTVRHCAGFNDLFSNGLLFPCWAEYKIHLSPLGIRRVECSTEAVGPNGAGGHDLKHQANNAWPDYENVKLLSPWNFWCSEPIRWAWIQPTWLQRNPDEYILPPAITEFRYQTGTHVNLLVKRPVGEEDKIIHIESGTPLVHLVPLIERPWDIEIKMMDPKIWNEKFTKWDHSFRLGYLKTRNILENKKQCKY